MIFENPFKYRRKGDRRKMSRVALFGIMCIASVVFAVMFAMYYVAPPEKVKTVNANMAFDQNVLEGIRKKVDLRTAMLHDASEYIPEKNPNQDIIDKRILSIPHLPQISAKPFLSTAYLFGNSPIHEEAMRSYAKELDMVFPDWLSLIPGECISREYVDWNTFEILGKNNIVTIPRFSNIHPILGVVDFSNILRIEGQGLCLIDNLKHNVKNRSVAGITIEIENLLPTDRNVYTAWLLSLVESFHKDGLYVMVTIPMNQMAYDYENIGRIADAVVVQAFDEHSKGGIPGPVAGTYWFEHSFENLLKTIPPSKTIMALGLHGYDWDISNETAPEQRSFGRTMYLAESTQAPIKWDDRSQNNNFLYIADDGSYHEAWFLDGVSAWKEYQFIRTKQIRGMSVRLTGDEDPSIWKFMGTNAPLTFDPKELNISAPGWRRDLMLSGQDIVSSKYTLIKEENPILSYHSIAEIGKSLPLLVATIRERFSLVWKAFVPRFEAGAWYFLVVLFIVTTIVSFFRIIFLGVFVFRSHSFRKKLWPRTFLHLPKVTVLVPAYNEEKVIERTIHGLLASDYPAFEILVLDDGSVDDTAACVKKVMEHHPNVRLISKKNEGKSKALNLGFQEAKYDYVITVDADTIVLPKTIFYLMEPFVDKKVDAVCGNIGVGNVKNVLTAFQEVEYVTGQNYDRRAFDALNCISVVPGATGAWKRQKVLDIGGYASDTLVEDADLTLTLLEHGGCIVYAPLAKSVTEAPETVGPLFKQRFRWSYGTFQCFWKHRKTFGKGTLGIIALPNMLFFQVIFPALSPIGDIVLLVAIFTGNLEPIIAAYVLFFFMDAVVSGAAYVLDKKSLSHIWVIVIQRFFYRQFMYFVTFRSIIAAVGGSHHGWNKLERKGSVTVTQTT